MCNCDDTSPDAFTRRTVRARKAHRCVECDAAIPAGASYEVISGIWGGEPDRFRTCSTCAEVRHLFERRPGAHCPVTVGDLYECIREEAEGRAQAMRSFEGSVVMGHVAGVLFRRGERRSRC